MLLNFRDCNLPIVIKVVERFLKVVTPKISTEALDFLIARRGKIRSSVCRTVLDVIPDITPQHIPKRSAEIAVNRIELHRFAGGLVPVSLRKAQTAPRIDITPATIRTLA